MRRMPKRSQRKSKKDKGNLIMNDIPQIVGHETELRGRRTTMEIVDVVAGDRQFKYEIVHRPEAAVAIVETFGGNFIFIKQFDLNHIVSHLRK